MPGIFLSYRRDDSGAVAGRLYDQLVAEVGVDGVFMDLDTIPYGVDYRAHIAGWLPRCDVVLALIGSRWLGERADGHRRIDDDADLVRVELQEALHHGLRIIPVLIDDQPMPPATELPSGLKVLSTLNAAPLNSTRDLPLHSAQLIRAIVGRSARSMPAARGDLYDELWQLIEEAHIELRDATASAEAIATRIHAVNSFVLTRAPHLDDEVHSLTTAYLGLLQQVKEELVRSADPELQEQFAITAQISLASVQNAKRLAGLLEEVAETRAQLLALVRENLRGGGRRRRGQ